MRTSLLGNGSLTWPKPENLKKCLESILIQTSLLKHIAHPGPTQLKMARLIRSTKPSQALAWLDSIESWEIHHSGAVDRPICKDPLLLHVPRLDPAQYKSSALDYDERRE